MHQYKIKSARGPAKVTTTPKLATALTEEMSLVSADKVPLAEGVKKVTDRWNAILGESDSMAEA